MNEGFELFIGFAKLISGTILFTLFWAIILRIFYQKFWKDNDWL